MKKGKWMKQLLVTAALLLAAAAVTTGCGGQDQSGVPEGGGKPGEISQPIKIAALNGPTGMGLAPLLADQRFEITLYQSPDEVTGKIVSGEVDIAAVPSNLGAVLYNKTEGKVSLLAVNTGGVLYLMENGEAVANLSDLKRKTIYASGQGGAPQFILQRILLDAGLSPEDVTVQWLANHSDVASSASVDPGSVALLPEPFVTVTKGKNEEMRIAFDLNQIWKDTYDTELPMGTMIASRDMVENREADLQVFLKEYEEGVNFVNSNPGEAAVKIAAAGIVSDTATAEAAIPRCNIIFLGGTDAREAVSNFYDILFQMEPKSVGGKLPDEAFYYSY